jgi:hypothetical protein
MVMKFMKLSNVVTLIQGKVISNSYNPDTDVKGGCGADLMSDVLASTQPDSILLTGLCNPQVVRTAQIADVRAIIFVRGKTPPQETIELALQESIPLFSTPLGMFEACGRLYEAGLPSYEGMYDL